MNFVTLALVVWLVYQLQVFVHFQDTSDAAASATSYIVTFSAVYLSLMALFAICLRTRWNTMTVADRSMGILSAARLGSIALGSLATLGIALLLGWTPIVVFGAIFIWAIVGRLIGQVIIRRIAA